MSISGSAKLAGIIGWPVAHSLSPLLHGHWLSEYRIDGAFVPLAVRREVFSDALRGLRLCGFRGVNVTVPHKEAAFALSDLADAAASATGAANLLLFAEDGRIEARNTDSAGLAASLSETLGDRALAGCSAIVMGAGGAARAAVRALDDLGAREIHVFNRNGPRAEGLVADLKRSTRAALSAAALGQWQGAAPGARVLVNATSAGMSGTPALGIALDALPKEAVICDLVYNPLETPLLSAARMRGHRTIDGLGMLMNQAVPAFEAFFGRRPDVTPALRRLMEQALS